MARYLDVHPDNPQPRAIAQIAQVVRDGGVIAYPTDSCYALGCALGNKDGVERIRRIRQLGEKHHLTLVCRDFAQLGQFVQLDNAVFRQVKASTPGPYTFVLPATALVPRAMLDPKRRTIGARIPRSALVQALLTEVGEPIMSTTLQLPGAEEPPTEGWVVDDEIGQLVDVVVDAGTCGVEPTTVIDFTDGEAVVVRAGAGDVSRFV